MHIYMHLYVCMHALDTISVCVCVYNVLIVVYLHTHAVVCHVVIGHDVKCISFAVSWGQDLKEIL